MKKSIAIIGAGITGITTAYYAAKAGYQVTVYDEERYAGMRTSFANGGQISVSNSEVWTTWSNVKKGIKWMFRKDAPLRFKLYRPDVAMWRWVIEFLEHTAKGDYIPNTAKTVQLGLESRELYEEIRQEEGIYFDRSACGILHFYKSKSYWDDALKITEVYNNNGLDRAVIDNTTIAEIDPALKDIRGVVGATYTPSDWTGDIHKFCYNLAEVLKDKYGVEFKYETTVDGRDIVKQYDVVIVSAGVGSALISNQIGDNLPIYPVKGYSITINNVDPDKLPKVSLLDDEAKIVTATLGNRFRVAGTAELAGENYDITRDRIEPLLKWVHTNFPEINTHDYTSYACLRPMTPNMMPIVKQSEHNPKVYYNTGHGHLGWTLGPVTAKRIIELVKSTS